MSELGSPHVSTWLVWGARTLAAAGVGVLILAGCRYALRLDPLAGKLVSLGVAVRLLAYAGLFFISYFDLPFLRELHTGDGFWRVSPDAKLYHDLALGIPGPDVSLAPSPGFVRVLGAWMWMVGPGPAAAALLNTTCYVGVCLLVMKLLRGEARAMRLLAAALSFSPALIVFGSQPLKDPFFLSLVVALCAVAWFVMGHLARPEWRTAVLLGVMLALGFFLLAGIRPYYAIFLLAALAGALPFAALAGRPRVVRTLWAAAVVGISTAAVLSGMSAAGRSAIARFSGVALSSTGSHLSSAAGADRPVAGRKRPAQPPGQQPANVLTRDLAVGSTILSVKHDNLFAGNVLTIEGHGQRELLYVGGVDIVAASRASDQLAFNSGGNACGGRYFNDGKAFYIPDGPHAGRWVQATGGCTYAPPHTVVRVTGDVTSNAASGHLLYFEDRSTDPPSYQYINISRDYRGSGASHAWKAGDSLSNSDAPVETMPARILLTLDRARWGFVSAGGRTNFGGKERPAGVWDRIGATLRGAGAMTIPVFVLRPLGALEVGPMTGFLAIAELDTVFNAGVLLAIGFVLWRGRARCRRHAWYLAFLGVIVVLTGLGFAYVITNFGTLFRMRLMVMMPLWMTLLAMGEPAWNRQASPSSRADVGTT
jgi:hypothetical protein